MRERMCSAWTVTLHFQMPNLLAEGMRASAGTRKASALEDEAKTSRRTSSDCCWSTTCLLGYALFEHDDVASVICCIPRTTLPAFGTARSR